MKLLHKDTQTTWTVENLLKEGFIKVGSKTYEEYWKDTKTNDILVLSVMSNQDKYIFRIYKLGKEDHTTLTFPTKESVLNFLCSVYDHVHENVYNDGSFFRCKTTAILLYIS